ncbi:class I SAM-dependent methyltransferase [bacterium]|nr:class I SAM-dependent methyltransferase [bacterium]
MPTVEDFYESFDIKQLLIGSPDAIQEFVDGEIEFLEKYLKSNTAILEVGCGYGRLLPVLQKRARRVVGVDFSRSLIKKAKKFENEFSNIKLKHMDARKLDLSDGIFDYTLCLNATFGNMPDIEEEVFQEMVRVTKTGGEVIISVFSDNAKEAQVANYKRLGLTNIHDTGNSIVTGEGLVSRRFTREELENFAVRAGMKNSIHKVAPINYILVAIK